MNFFRKNAETGKVKHPMAFHPGLHCLIKYKLRIYQSTKGFGLTSLIFRYNSCHVLQQIKFFKLLIRRVVTISAK